MAGGMAGGNNDTQLSQSFAIAPALLVIELRVYEKQMKPLPAFNAAGFPRATIL
jgi:hypothetical protein